MRPSGNGGDATDKTVGQMHGAGHRDKLLRRNILQQSEPGSQGVCLRVCSGWVQPGMVVFDEEAKNRLPEKMAFE